jgi:hypothetical protein
MLIVGCQICGESKVLAGTPDKDGVARVHWTCSRCGTGQVLWLDVSNDATGGGSRRILCEFDGRSELDEPGELALDRGDYNGTGSSGDPGKFYDFRGGLR